jgi:beta-lactamase class A
MNVRFGHVVGTCALVLVVGGGVACGTTAAKETPPAETPPEKPPTPPEVPAQPDASTGPVGCPAGLGAKWTCDGSRRIRCVDDQVKAETCAAGCAAGEDGESICSCGSHPTFSHWNCMPDGTRSSCAGGDSWIVDSCAGKTCATGADGESDLCKNDGALQHAVDDLGASCGTLANGVHCAIALRDLTTNERAGYDEQVSFDSASAAKVFWVTAALFDTSVDAVAPFVHPIFEQSDNIATGQVIDLLKSPDRVNTFLWQDAEVADIGFCAWNYGATRTANNCPHVLGDDNFFTTNDAVSFLTELWDDSLLGRDKSNTLLSWMTLSPREGYGGWLGTQLPAAARTTMHHKAGWLPPEAVPGYSNANEIGIIEIPGGHTYAVAFALDGAPSQADYDNSELPLLEYLSCRVYHAVAGDDASSCAAP